MNIIKKPIIARCSTNIPYIQMVSNCTVDQIITILYRAAQFAAKALVSYSSISLTCQVLLKRFWPAGDVFDPQAPTKVFAVSYKLS